MNIINVLFGKYTHYEEMKRLREALVSATESRDELFQQYAEAKAALAQCQHLIGTLLTEKEGGDPEVVPPIPGYPGPYPVLPGHPQGPFC